MKSISAKFICKIAKIGTSPLRNYFTPQKKCINDISTMIIILYSILLICVPRDFTPHLFGLSIFPSILPYVCPSIPLPKHPSFHRSLRILVPLFIFTSIHLSVPTFFCLSLHPGLCPSIFPFFLPTPFFSCGHATL